MFETFSLSFEKERDAMDVFESVKELTVCSERPILGEGRVDCNVS